MAGDGTQGISSFMTHCGGEKKNAEQQNIQSCFPSVALGVTPLPEMSKGHREAQLKITQHSHSIVERKETLCRGDNSHRTSAGMQWR